MSCRLGGITALVGAVAIGAWSCSSFSGVDTQAVDGGSDALPDASLAEDDAGLGDASSNTPFCAPDAGSIVCDDFERAELTGGVWSVKPASAPTASLHLAADSNANHYLEIVTAATSGNALYMFRNVDVAGSSFTLDVELGYQALVGDGGPDQYLNTFGLYFDDATMDGGNASSAAVFVKVDPVAGVSLVLQSGPGSLTDAKSVVPQPAMMTAPTHLRLQVDITANGSAKASLAGLTASPVLLDGTGGNTKGHYGTRLRQLVIGDSFIANKLKPGARTRFDNVRLSQP